MHALTGCATHQCPCLRTTSFTRLVADFMLTLAGVSVREQSEGCGIECGPRKFTQADVESNDVRCPDSNAAKEMYEGVSIPPPMAPLPCLFMTEDCGHGQTRLWECHQIVRLLCSH